MLSDTPRFRRFSGIDMIGVRISGETMILNFRHLLEESKIAQQILESLSMKGAMVEDGVILHATTINRTTRPVQPGTKWRA